jgi:O-antigen ligase
MDVECRHVPSPEPRLPSHLALVVLVVVAALGPWPFGAVQPWAILAVTALGLGTVTVALAVGALGGGVARPDVPLWPLVGFLALGVAQLVPLPPSLHALVAPGSDAVWHPSAEAARVVLGEGPHPVSLDLDTTLRAVALVAALGLLAWIAAPAFTRSRAAVLAAGSVSAGGFVLAAYAIFARAHFGKLLYGRIDVPTVHPFGPFVSKNHFAGYVAMAALLAAGLALGLAREARGRARDWTTSPQAGLVVLVLVAALTMALADVASLSRGGVIALAAGALALLGLLVRAGGERRRRGLLLSLAVAGTLGLVVITLAPPEAHERLPTLRGSSFRIDTWRDTLRLGLASPVVGQGLGAFHDAYPRFKQGHGQIRVEHAENDYLETFAETGLVGLALALLGAARLVSSAARDAGAARVVRGIGMGATAGLVALAVHSAVDFNLRIPSNGALAALLAAAALGPAGVRARPLSRGGAASLAVATALLLAAVARPPGQPWLDAREEAVQAAAASSPWTRVLRLERAEVDLVRVLRRRPAHAESWIMLAGVHAARGDGAAGAALARHALALDPERPALRKAADRLLR